MIQLVIIVVIVITLIKHHFNRKWLIRQFEIQNCIVFGKKGTGKDTLFAWVIKRRKHKHYSNIRYNDKTEVRPISDLSVGSITFDNLIDGNFFPIEKKLEENVDYYISEAGLNLPSQFSHLLDKKYPSFPIYYSLVRHLTNSNIHANTQALCRPWNKLREQADCYIKCCGVINIGRICIQRVRVYEMYESADRNLKPYRCGIFSSREARARAEEHRSLYGDIRNITFVHLREKNGYDSRHFHRVIYGVPAPSKTQRKQ